MELLLDIAEYLSPIHRAIMQRVCNKFREGLASSKISPEYEGYTGSLDIFVGRSKDIIQFSCLLRRDKHRKLQEEYTRMCDASPIESSLNRLGCSGCLTIHPKESFSSKQLAIRSQSRVCTGLEGSFQICQHFSFSGECVFRALREMKNAELFCQSHHPSNVGGKRLEFRAESRSYPRIGYHGGHTITVDRLISILILGTKIEIPPTLLDSSIRGRCVDICPHLNTTSPELFNGKPVIALDCDPVRSREVPRMRYDQGILVPAPWEHRFVDVRLGWYKPWFQCRHPDCYTRYCLREIDMRVVLVISRDIFGSPTHPGWKAQMEAELGFEGTLKTDSIDREARLDVVLEPKTPECAARFNKCKGECALARYQQLMES
ncbi:hypothetical protein BT63DRAFT_268711 [Microthyrium microscopicum]|uniref:F-box domain-containing protein n=1 Tax=Microthyrium microscopicum TaxID=703497 RepID=A0A6A6U7A2_9PEZI|nr:hypothetical protein BT63DRAFT_268711 [Microthyrium microscopicum]